MDQVTLPPVVYAPTIDLDGATRIRMHRMRDGRTALFVYSAIDRLQAQYGDDARWVLLGIDDLQRAYDRAPYDLLLLDRELHPQEPDATEQGTERRTERGTDQEAAS